MKPKLLFDSKYSSFHQIARYFDSENQIFGKDLIPLDIRDTIRGQDNVHDVVDQPIFQNPVAHLEQLGIFRTIYSEITLTKEMFERANKEIHIIYNLTPLDKVQRYSYFPLTVVELRLGDAFTSMSQGFKLLSMMMSYP